ncbi:hypothetical protein SAMD00019534_119910 [Acytostelium subglobosum LB1]|uniref:hypothetical protein n=1 Tax=Acytostelium subglobosum LB1 TaxID=1410327 RepID=UPI000644E6E4|nr:hypothetical protein SAMD00019534_119910 [Acytostelium subglobosum LB1]GAM28815.1 hypothetical protein SAMD00019534_119910 [Acytostelium subglobosum LB1]|eukprot:XP_012748187.1 hypothetical protein SAMD00019534_119910 [Acytostelium subglobosum LB1]
MWSTVYGVFAVALLAFVIRSLPRYLYNRAQRMAWMQCLIKGRWLNTSTEEHAISERRMLEMVTTPIEQKFVKVGQYQINTIKTGSGDPLVMVHGFGSALGFWCANIDFLSQYYTVYAIDVLGFGRSSRFDTTNIKTPEQAEEFWVNIMYEWTEQVGLDNFNLLGHSLGGYLSTCFTLKHPEKVKSLVLADAWGFAEKPKDYEQNVSLFFKFLSKVIAPPVPLRLMRKFGPFGQDYIYLFRQDLLNKFHHLYPEDDLKYNPERPNRVAEYFYHSNTQEPASGEYLFSLLAMAYGFAANPLINRASMIAPTVDVTLLFGSNTWIDQATGPKLKQEMKNIKDVVIIEDSGHHIYIDNIHQFNQAVLKATGYHNDAPAAAQS